MTGATADQPPGPNSLFERGVNRCGWRALLPMPRLPRSAMLLREPLAGTTVHTSPGTLGHLPAWFWQYKLMNRLGRLSVILIFFRLTSEKPVVRTHLRPPKFPKLDSLF
jgi:hypothetical protein